MTEPTKQCTGCRHTKPLGSFVADARRRDGHAARCKRCRRGELARWRAENIEILSEQRRRGRLRRDYGITVEQYDALLADQGGGCAICGTPDGAAGRRLHVDHDAASLRIRGLLCSGCNRGIGYLRHDPDALGAAAIYVVEADTGLTAQPRKGDVTPFPYPPNTEDQ